jgi:hypothetical protein
VTGATQNDDVINNMVLRFLSPASHLPPGGVGLGLPYQAHSVSPADMPETDIILSAVELYEAGIRFKKSARDSLHDIRFRHGVLSMPAVSIDDSTEYMLLNMMAFEKLHVGAGNDVTAYVFFMDTIIHSAKDVALLSRWGIIQNTFVGTEERSHTHEHERRREGDSTQDFFQRRTPRRLARLYLGLVLHILLSALLTMDQYMAFYSRGTHGRSNNSTQANSLTIRTTRRVTV